jgi:hypothetical protein
MKRLMAVPPFIAKHNGRQRADRERDLVPVGVSESHQRASPSSFGR